MIRFWRDQPCPVVSTRQDFAESWNWTGNLRIEKMENSGVYAGTVLNLVEDNQWAVKSDWFVSFKLWTECME